jgi:hypothetical protein
LWGLSGRFRVYQEKAGKFSTLEPFLSEADSIYTNRFKDLSENSLDTEALNPPADEPTRLHTVRRSPRATLQLGSHSLDKEDERRAKQAQAAFWWPFIS